MFLVRCFLCFCYVEFVRLNLRLMVEQYSESAITK